MRSKPLPFLVCRRLLHHCRQRCCHRGHRRRRPGPLHRSPQESEALPLPRPVHLTRTHWRSRQLHCPHSLSRRFRISGLVSCHPSTCTHFQPWQGLHSCVSAVCSAVATACTSPRNQCDGRHTHAQRRSTADRLLAQEDLPISSSELRCSLATTGKRATSWDASSGRHPGQTKTAARAQPLVPPPQLTDLRLCEALSLS